MVPPSAPPLLYCNMLCVEAVFQSHGLLGQRWYHHKSSLIFFKISTDFVEFLNSQQSQNHLPVWAEKPISFPQCLFSLSHLFSHRKPQKVKGQMGPLWEISTLPAKVLWNFSAVLACIGHLISPDHSSAMLRGWTLWCRALSTRAPTGSPFFFTTFFSQNFQIEQILQYVAKDIFNMPIYKWKLQF